MARSNATIFFLSLTCGAAEGAAPGIGPYVPVGAVVGAPVAATGAPQPAHTAEPGAIGCPQLAQNPVPSPFCAPQAAQKAWLSFNCAPHFFTKHTYTSFYFLSFLYNKVNISSPFCQQICNKSLKIVKIRRFHRFQITNKTPVSALNRGTGDKKRVVFG